MKSALSPRTLAAKILRVTTAAAVTGLFFSFVLAGKVYGDVSDLAVRFGDELQKVPVERSIDGVIHGDYYRLRINDASLEISTATTKRGVDEVLDRAERDCKIHADGMAEDFAHLDRAMLPDAVHSERGVPGVGLVHTGLKTERGYVLCFATGHDLAPFEGWHRVKEAGVTGDVSKIGHLRYLTARKVDGQTQVIAIWTDAPWNLFHMFPKDGDAPGSDPPGIPRPEGSRRLLTAYPEGAPAAVRIYDVPMTRADAYRYYQEKMPYAGFEPRMWADDPALGAAYGNQIGDYVVVAQASSEGHTTVTVTESRNRRVQVETRMAR